MTKSAAIAIIKSQGFNARYSGSEKTIFISPDNTNRKRLALSTITRKHFPAKECDFKIEMA